MAAKKQRTIVVSARRWFDGSNTYHSVRVVDDGKELVAPFEYGYGDHYMHTAGTLLGLKDPYAFGRRWAVEKGIALVVDVADVQRKKDLHNGGRALKGDA
jgi:hypothetical protein